MKRLLWGVLFLGWMFPFQPRDGNAFVNNCLRLLNTQQYSFLTQYFEEYYPQFREYKNDDYVLDIVVRIPFVDKKEVVLRTYINHAPRVNPSAYDLFGQIKFFEKEYQDVIKAYLRYDQPERFYYLGWAEKELGNLIDAQRWFLKAIKEIENQELKEHSYLGLAEIYIRWENFSGARKALRKVSNRNYRKMIAYYHLYKAEKNEDFLKRIIARIKSYPKDDPVIRDFLQAEGLE